MHDVEVDQSKVEVNRLCCSVPAKVLHTSRAVALNLGLAILQVHTRSSSMEYRIDR